MDPSLDWAIAWTTEKWLVARLAQKHECYFLKDLTDWDWDKGKAYEDRWKHFEILTSKRDISDSPRRAASIFLSMFGAEIGATLKYGSEPYVFVWRVAPDIDCNNPYEDHNLWAVYGRGWIVPKADFDKDILSVRSRSKRVMPLASGLDVELTDV